MTTTSPTDPVSWPAPADVDLRLVVADLDGTLLDGAGRAPAGLWPLLEQLRDRDITFAPASGRQYATLRRMFDRAAEGMTFIAENGAVVMRDGEELFTAPLDVPTVVEAVRAQRDSQADGRADGGVVVACARTALVERTDERFIDAARLYYNDITVVPDLVQALASDDAPVPVKLALFDVSDVADPAEEILGCSRDTHEVVISGQNWADLMASGVDKGNAVQALQRSLGITPEQTAAFGDYLNDLGMIRASGLSFAMENGHPDLVEAARFTAPANTEEGVLTVLSVLLGLDGRTPGSRV